MSFRPHVQEVSIRARSRLGVLRAVTGTTFGNSKESVAALYKQYVRPVMEYVCPVWTTGLALTHHNILQKTQNAALRFATGCTRSTPVQHLHNQCKVLHLKQHKDMRDAQLLAKAEDPAHACHSLLTPRVSARAVWTTPAAYMRGCLEPVPSCPRYISMVTAYP